MTAERGLGWEPAAHLGVGAHKVPCQRNRKLFRAARPAALLCNIVHLPEHQAESLPTNQGLRMASNLVYISKTPNVQHAVCTQCSAQYSSGCLSQSYLHCCPL